MYRSRVLNGGLLSLALTAYLVASCSLIGRSNSANASARESRNTLEQWRSIKVQLHENKKSMCSFLLVQKSDASQIELTLDRVADLFEQGLDHVGRSADYIKVMRPYIDQRVVSQFDLNGSKFVLEISDARRKLIEEFGNAVANGASDATKGQILEEYFYKACEIKLGSVAAEKSMFAALQKIEGLANSKLHNGQAVA